MTETLPTIYVIASEEMLSRLPGSGFAVDNAAIYQSHVLTADEVLRKVPGVYVRDEEGFGLRPNIAVRGLNPNRSSKVLLMEDGIPISLGPYGNNASSYQPAVERFDHVEVLKGASQLLYGPQTIASAVNFISPTPPAMPGGYASFTGGSRDFFGGQIHYGGRHGAAGGLLDYVRKQGDGLRDNTELQFDDVNLKATYDFTPDVSLTGRLNIFREDSVLGSEGGITEAELRNFRFRYNPFDSDEFNTNRWGASLTHQWQLNAHTMATTNVYWSSFIRDWWRQANRSTDTQCGTAFRENRLNGVAVDPATCNSVQGRLRDYYFWGIEPRIDIEHRLFGFDNVLKLAFRAHNEEQVRRQINGTSASARVGTLVEKNERSADAHAFFGQNTFELGTLSVTPAVRFESIDVERINLIATGGCAAPPCRGREAFTAVTPGLSVSYAPRGELTVFAGAHEGFAPPRVEDLLSDSGGSVEVDPEQSINIEAGVHAAFIRGLEFDATYFRNDFDNLIAEGAVAGGDVPLAQGEALFEGSEVFARVNTVPFIGSLHDLYIEGAWTWTWTAEQTSSFIGVEDGQPVQGNTQGNRQPYAPEHLLTATIGYTHPRGVDLRFETVFVDSQFADFLNLESPTDHPEGPTSVNARSGQFGKIDPYTVFNLAATWTVQPSKLDLFFTIKNLFDHDYIANRTGGIVPGSPRLFQAGLKYSF